MPLRFRYKPQKEHGKRNPVYILCTRKERMMSHDGLTNDMIFEILSRASLETVGKCRLVSRECNEITYETSFRDLHSARTRTVSGFFVQGSTNNDCRCSFVPLNGDGGPVLSLGCLPGPVKIVAGHGGILLCRKERADRSPYVPQYYVCKPSTGEWMKIPNPRTKHSTLETAMVVVRSKPELHYKILRISNPHCKNHGVFGCEIFDSVAGGWKRLPDIKNAQYQYVFAPEDPVVVGGTAFWLEADGGAIFSFDMYEETWDRFPVTSPDSEREHYGYPRLVNHEGKLGFLRPGYDGVFVDLWVVDDIQAREWKKRKRIRTEEVGCPADCPLALFGANVVLLQGFYKVVLCRFPPPTTNEFKTKHICGSQIFPYCSDLEPANFPVTNRKVVSRPRPEPTTRNVYQMIFRLTSLLAGPWMRRLFSP